MPGQRILIVEDEFLVARDIEQQLRTLGYEPVGIAGTSEDALSLASTERPQLVLMDIRIRGDVDGIDTARLMADRHRMPVIFLTAHADEATVARARTAQPYGYLLKPFHELDLRTSIEMALYKHDAERRLRDSERRYATTLASIGDGVVATDTTGLVTFLNPVAEGLTGWSNAEAIGRPFTEVFVIINQFTRLPAENPVERVIREGTVVGLANHTVLVSRDGRETAIDDCAAPIADDGGGFSGVVLVFRDVTEKYEAEATRTRLEEELRQAHKLEAIGRLAGGIAHDFNNLLTVIKGYSEIIRDELPRVHELHPLVEDICTASTRASELTRQLLVFSRRQVLSTQPMDLNETVKGAMRLVTRLITESVEIRADYGGNLPRISADPLQVEQVVMNLAVNARDAMPGGGRLLLSTSVGSLDADRARAVGCSGPGEFCTLTVSDTGHGMDATTRSRIFEPFFTTKGVGGGTGLGLATVYGIVRQTGGFIEVDSEPGKGARFTVWFPQARVQEETRKTVTRASENEGGTETILLVEDEDGVRRLCRHILQRAGYSVVEAGDGVAALQAIARLERTPDMLLSDLVMPKMSGRVLGDILAGQCPGIRMLFMSGYSESVLGDQAAGIELLPKPFTPPDLLRAVRRVLDGRPVQTPPN
jgi:two-component system cell cycle sensor histidine kinase/response regulator CckA